MVIVKGVELYSMDDEYCEEDQEYDEIQKNIIKVTAAGQGCCRGSATA